MAKKPSKVDALRQMREGAAARRTTNLPALSTANAPLPQMYEAAREALAECQRVDECKDWADKAQALASYARQAEDETLFNFARRIQARASRRAGELLKTYQNQTAGLKNVGGSSRTVGTGPTSQRAAAESAGMSERQEKTAVRVSNVPEEDFEAAVESDEPPTMTALADMGKGSAPPKNPPASAREGFYQATHTMGAMRRFAEFCEKGPPELVANGLLDHEHAEARDLVHTIDAWLDRFIVNLKKSA